MSWNYPSLLSHIIGLLCASLSWRIRTPLCQHPIRLNERNLLSNGFVTRTHTRSSIRGGHSQAGTKSSNRCSAHSDKHTIRLPQKSSRRHPGQFQCKLRSKWDMNDHLDIVVHCQGKRHRKSIEALNDAQLCDVTGAKLEPLHKAVEGKTSSTGHWNNPYEQH